MKTKNTYVVDITATVRSAFFNISRDAELQVRINVAVGRSPSSTASFFSTVLFSATNELQIEIKKCDKRVHKLRPS